jgi:hypothetical protein
MILSNTQKNKRRLEVYLDRMICDSSFYKIAKNLKSNGWTEKNYHQIFPVIGLLSRTSPGRILIPSKKAIQTVNDFYPELGNNHLMSCLDFQEKALTLFPESIKPKDRVIKGKKYPSSNWCRWFNRAGLVYSMREEYELQDLRKVLLIILYWIESKTIIELDPNAPENLKTQANTLGE